MKPLIGDNSHKLTDREREAIFGHHARKIIQNGKDAAKVKDERKELLDDAKNDLGNVKELQAFIKAMEDGDGMLKKHLITQAGLMRAGFLAKGSGDLLDRVDREQEIFAKGKAAGLMGADRVSGYDAGHTDDKTWLSGWDDGQRIMREELQSAMEKLIAQRGETPDTDEDPFDLGEAAE